MHPVRYNVKDFCVYKLLLPSIDLEYTRGKLIMHAEESFVINKAANTVHYTHMADLPEKAIIWFQHRRVFASGPLLIGKDYYFKIINLTPMKNNEYPITLYSQYMGTV